MYLHDLVADVHGPRGVRRRAEADVGELVVAAERRHHVEAQRLAGLAQRHRVQRRGLQDHGVGHVLNDIVGRGGGGGGGGGHGARGLLGEAVALRARGGLQRQLQQRRLALRQHRRRAATRAQRPSARQYTTQSPIYPPYTT